MIFCFFLICWEQNVNPVGYKIWIIPSLRSCPLPLSPVCNLFSGGGHDTFLSQITCKKARIWTFSDWIGNNMDDLRCSHWPKRRHLLVVVDFSLHFACVMSSEYTRQKAKKQKKKNTPDLRLDNSIILP